jgi:hypothetical protein
VIFFSTQGSESPTASMSGGDMDGDMFLVCLHPRIIHGASGRPVKTPLEQMIPPPPEQQVMMTTTMMMMMMVVVVVVVVACRYFYQIRL